MNFSDEQKSIGDSLKNNYNVCVLATAGSGKTTSIKYIYSLFSSDEIISMTFNKHLADESRSSICNYIKSTDICFHTVHSLGNYLYGIPCPDNNGLYKIIKENIKLTKDLTNIKVIIYDECQDMNDLFYDFFVKLIKDIQSSGGENILQSSSEKGQLRICLLGDDKQCINRFTGATTKFILNPYNYFSPFIEGEWKLLQLSTTYRLSKPIADFVNNVIKGVRQCSVIIDPNSKTDKPDYIIGDMFNPKYFDHILNIIDRYANKTYDNVALICKSVKSMSNPVHRFVNYLKHVRPYINIYRTKSEDEIRDDKVMNGKLVVSSIHQMKGQERDIIIYFLFDDSFYNINKLSKIPEPTDECPNAIYVGLTRAKKHMILCHHNRNGFLPFVDTQKLQLYSNFYIMDNLNIQRDYKSELIITKNVTDVVSYIDIETVNCILTEYSKHEISKGTGNTLKFNNVLIQTSKDSPIYEDMSGLIGQIIPILANCKYYGLEYSDYLEKVCSVNDFEGSFTNKYVNEFKRIIKKDEIQVKEFVYAVHIYYSYSDRYLHELHQLKGNYEWIDDDYRMYNICASRIIDNMKSLNIKSSISNKGHVYFEYPISHKFQINPFEITVNGYIDCLYSDKNDEVTITEYKCAEFKDSHILQLICYGCMYFIVHKKIATLKLYYPLTDTTIKVQVNDIETNCYKIMNRLISQKTNLECDLGNITFSFGAFRGYSFKELYNEYEKDSSISDNIHTSMKMMKHDQYRKEYETFLFYIEHTN